MDILDRLEKLENLVRHDDEARQVCADARQEILKLRGTGGGGGSGDMFSSWPQTFRVSPPPSQTTQVKMDRDCFLAWNGSTWHIRIEDDGSISFNPV